LNGSLTIARAGLLSTLQDRGRFGLRHLGIPWSGCLVPHWQQLANNLVRNAPHTCVIECWEGGLQVNVEDHPVRIAIAGHTSVIASIESAQRKISLAPMRSYTAQVGDTIALTSTGNMRQAVMAIAGLMVEPQLGSASTYAKASLGGLNGNVLQNGSEIRFDCKPDGPELRCTDPLIAAYQQTDIRLVMGPQEMLFSIDGVHNLLNEEYELSSDADRMGVRLSGPAIFHGDDDAKNIVSDAIVPGSIQVPGNGQPIILLSDAHTAGGYPKVATVISIDLPLPGLLRAGTRFRFRAISIDEAIHETRQQHELVRKTVKNTTPVIADSLSTLVLLANNLIDGVIDGTS